MPAASHLERLNACVLGWTQGVGGAPAEAAAPMRTEPSGCIQFLLSLNTVDARRRRGACLAEDGPRECVPPPPTLPLCVCIRDVPITRYVCGDSTQDANRREPPLMYH